MKTIVLQLSRLGDLLQSTLLLNSLKKNNKTVYILGDEKNIAIAREIPVIDKFIPLKIGEILNFIKKKNFNQCYNYIQELVTYLNSEKFDELYNLNHSNINFYLSLLINATVKKGFKVENNKFINFIYKTILNREGNRFNLVDIFNCFAKPSVKANNIFISKKEYDKNIYFLKKVLKKDTNIILHCGAGHPLREWSVNNFVKLAEIILDNFNATITLTGVKSEKKIGIEFSNKLKPEYKKRIINLIGKTDILLLKSLLMRSEVLVSTDTGIMHLAAACGTRIVSLFYASALVYETGAYTKNAIAISPAIDCYPCTELIQSCSDFFCKNLITPFDIFESIKFLLNYTDKENFRNFVSKREKIIFYEPYFDEFGICYKNILEDNIAENFQIREKGFKLCMNSKI